MILSYAITIHKSQGISLKTVVIDAGVHNLAKGQIYVALSRVTSLTGLHLINYDTFKIIADTLAILQYNSLRQKFRPDLVNYCLPATNHRYRHVELVWTIPREVLDVQQNNDPANNTSNLRRFPEDGFSSFTAVTLLFLLSNQTLRNQIKRLPLDDILNVIINNYWANRLQDLREFVFFAGHEYNFGINNNIALPNLLQLILNKSYQINNIVMFKGVYAATAPALRWAPATCT